MWSCMRDTTCIEQVNADSPAASKKVQAAIAAEAPTAVQKQELIPAVAAQPVVSASSLAEQCLDIRHAGMPNGKCVYLMAGDPGDFDGYLIAIAGAELEQKTSDFQLAVVVPERRACPDRAETDVNKHDAPFSEQIMDVVGKLMRLLCPTTMLVRGTLNARNVIPLKFVFSEPEKYGPLLNSRQAPGNVNWQSIEQLAAAVEDSSVTSIVMDMNGAVGFLVPLHQACPSLGLKIKAAGLPIPIMAGIRAEQESQTLRVPGRDPRATMNAIYDAAAVHVLLDMASYHSIPLLFVTNNVCNEALKFDTADELSEALGLQGLLLDLAKEWYGPHLHGKCVPFDWVSFCALLLLKRQPNLLRLEKRQLWVGENDASIMVLVDPGMERTAVMESQLEGTRLWGEVDNLVAIDKAAMLEVARYVCAKYVA